MYSSAARSSTSDCDIAGQQRRQPPVQFVVAVGVEAAAQCDALVAVDGRIDADLQIPWQSPLDGRASCAGTTCRMLYGSIAVVADCLGDLADQVHAQAADRAVEDVGVQVRRRLRQRIERRARRRGTPRAGGRRRRRCRPTIGAAARAMSVVQAVVRSRCRPLPRRSVCRSSRTSGAMPMLDQGAVDRREQFAQAFAFVAGLRSRSCIQAPPSWSVDKHSASTVMSSDCAAPSAKRCACRRPAIRTVSCASHPGVSAASRRSLPNASIGGRRRPR